MTHSPLTLEECKIRAAVLHKQLRTADPPEAHLAAERLRRLPRFAPLTADQILAQREAIQRKHTLAVIAMENGYANWVELKQALAVAPPTADDLLYPRRCEGFLNAWYPTHTAAHAHLTHEGGYLLPYKNHFFICERLYIETLGLDPDDPAWAKIGWDWAKPADPVSWQSLYNQLLRAE